MLRHSSAREPERPDVASSARLFLQSTKPNCARTMAERVRTDSRASQRPSRPGSSLSAATSSGARTATTTTTRPTSSLAYSTQQPPNHPKTPKPSAARYGGLAEKELQKVRCLRGQMTVRIVGSWIPLDRCPQLQSSIRAATKTGTGLNARLKQQGRPSLVREVDERDEQAGKLPLSCFFSPGGNELMQV